MPQHIEVIKHICVEGWSYIGDWTGVTAADLSRACRRGSRGAKYVAFKTADDYPEQHRHGDGAAPSDHCLHPVTPARRWPTLLAIPLRLRTSTKLGYKNPKWITAIEVTNTYPGGYWEKRGFPWFAGI